LMAHALLTIVAVKQVYEKFVSPELSDAQT